MYGNKCAKVIKIYEDVPIGSIVKEADILIKGKLITGNVYLKKHNLDNKNEFDLDGKINFRFHKKERSTHFVSDEIHSRFGKAAIKGESYRKKFKPKSQNA